MEFFVSALDSLEPDPNGQMRIFGIGTKVRVPTGQIGTVTKINRATLTVQFIVNQDRWPNIKTTRAFQPHLLEIVK